VTQISEGALVLADGTAFEGELIGAEADVTSLALTTRRNIPPVEAWLSVNWRGEGLIGAAKAT